MSLSCLFGRHWPLAAFSERREGYETSECVDCARPMEKDACGSWRAIPSRAPGLSSGPRTLSRA